MAPRKVCWRAGKSRAPWERRVSAESNWVSSWGGEKYLVRAAASSIARGSPSNRAQIAATAVALAEVNWKEAETACARATKSATASYCERCAGSRECGERGTERGETTTSHSACKCSTILLVTRTLSLEQAESNAATSGLASTTCSKLSSSKIGRAHV